MTKRDNRVLLSGEERRRVNETHGAMHVRSHGKLQRRRVDEDDPGLYAAPVGHLISGHNVAPRSRDIPDMEAQHRELHP